MKKILVPIADGIEEIESMTIIDVLRRAGADVIIASVQGIQITAAHGVKIVADKLIQECTDDEFDLIVLPGGMPGADNLRDSALLKELLVQQNSRGNQIAAICASPAVVFKPHGLLEGKKATCYPSFSGELGEGYTDHSSVISDGNCMTSQGPGTAMQFALQLTEMLFDKEKAEELRQAMLI